MSDARAQRTILVDQLASLKNTTVALEFARVDALDRQRARGCFSGGAGPEPALREESGGTGSPGAG